MVNEVSEELLRINLCSFLNSGPSNFSNGLLMKIGPNRRLDDGATCGLGTNDVGETGVDGPWGRGECTLAPDPVGAMGVGECTLGTDPNDAGPTGVCALGTDDPVVAGLNCRQVAVRVITGSVVSAWACNKQTNYHLVHCWTDEI